MENYTNTQTPGLGREKSVYLVHLDNVRIVILSCMLLGVIAVSFLIGMHLSGSSGDDIYSDTVIRSSSVDASAAVPATAAGEDILAKEGSALPAAPGEEKLSAGDLLATAQPGTTVQSPAPLVTKPIDSVTPKPSAAAPKPAQPKAASVKKTETADKPKTVAVSAPQPAAESAKAGYSVQIASFDSRDKAMIEFNHLQRLSYQPYIDKADVNGKTFFRVKIGPIATKSAAIETMNELQSTDKYKDSFIVYQK